MTFLQEIKEAVILWCHENDNDEPPRGEIVKAMREDGLDIEDAARIAPEGYRLND